MIRYRLDDLGWFQFEWLCQSLLRASYGETVEAWGGHSDLGRDAYCAFSVTNKSGNSCIQGPVVFQSKFVEEANASGATPFNNLAKAVTSEIGSIKARIKRGLITLPATFVLMTNAPISAAERAKLQAKLNGALEDTHIILWGADDLCSMLDNTPNIRTAFPQLLGLRDFEELLQSAVNKQVIERSGLQLSRAVELAQVFVPTNSYNQAIEVVERHGFVVLTGPPEVGKTTIARLIGLAKFGEGWEYYECQSPDDFLRLRTGDRPKVFVADDAFGTTEYRPDIAQKWEADLDSVLRAVDHRHWLIWTSRPAPLKLALKRMHLQGRAEKFPDPGEIVVDAANLTANERALILYRHAKAAKLEVEAKALVKKFAREIIMNRNFTPERAKRFVETTLPILLETKASQKEIQAAIKREIEHPTVSMKKSFDALSIEHQQILVAMLDVPDRLVSISALSDTVIRHNEKQLNVTQLADELGSHFLRSGNDYLDFL